LKVPSKSWFHALLLGSSLVVAAGLAASAPAASAAPQARATAWSYARALPGIPGLSPLGTLVPTPGDSSGLYAVYCVSAGDCWAVGTYDKGSGNTGATLNQALHWNGHKWSAVTVPNPSEGGLKVNVLNGVRCTSSSNCWAVGYYYKTGKPLSETLRWNGFHWTQVAAPSPGSMADFGFSVLFSVTCVSASSCWAAGEYGHFGGNSEVVRNLILHWNGSKWTTASVPNPAGTALGNANEISAVRCASPASCWAAGTYGRVGNPSQFRNEVLHWNGSKWGMVSVPSPGGSASDHVNYLYGVACTSVGNCWAAGTYGVLGTPNTYQNQVLHWNGHHWSLVSTPQPDGSGAGASNVLGDVTCPSAVNCWAVGDYGSIDSTGAGVVLNQALHWNGHHWSLVSTPDPAGLSDGNSDQLTAVRCATVHDCWAVGNAQSVAKAQVNEALHWNGSTWSAG
jgi:hypothetical protein